METPYQAVLLLSFGGPEASEEVMPFLERVVAGRGVPRERLEEVAKHYEHFGGKSPLNGHNRALVARLGEALRRTDHPLPVYFGNRHWHPLLADVLVQMRDDGVERALAFVTSAYGSYSGCRAYLEDMDGARRQVEGAPALDKLRLFFNHPRLIEASADKLRAAMAGLGDQDRGGARVVFTAHSIPVAMAQGSPYLAQLRETATLVAAAVGLDGWDLAFQSRSGPPQVPWLEPDICDHLRALHDPGVGAVVVAPIGFLADHMEVVYDLDIEARAVADGLGLSMVRADTVGDHPSYVDMIVELIAERLFPEQPRRSVGGLPAATDTCAVGCCPAGRPRRG